MKLVLCTAPAGTAQMLASTLVEEGLAACVNVVPGVVSTYRWRGKVETGGESLLVAKTGDDVVEALMARVKEIHEYETPEIVAVDVVRGDPGYLAWVDAETSSREKPKVSGSRDDEGVVRGAAPRHVTYPQEGTMKKKKVAKKAAKKTTAKKTKAKSKK